MVDITVAPLMVQSIEAIYGTTATIGGLLGGRAIDGPFVVVFDKPLRPKRGLIAQVPGDLEMGDFADTQAGGVDRHGDRAVLEVGDAREQTQHFVLVQYLGHFPKEDDM